MKQIYAQCAVRGFTALGQEILPLQFNVWGDRFPRLALWSG